MKLEKAIHQTKPFESEHERAIVNMIYSHGWLNGKMQNHFKKFGLTGKQYNILRILKGATQPISTSTLRLRLLDRSSDVSRIVDRMSTKGYIDKKTCKTDKRLVDLILTDKGHKTLREVDKHRDGIQDVMANLSKKEAKTLNDLLDKMRNNST